MNRRKNVRSAVFDLRRSLFQHMCTHFALFFFVKSQFLPANHFNAMKKRFLYSYFYLQICAFFFSFSNICFKSIRFVSFLAFPTSWVVNGESYTIWGNEILKPIKLKWEVLCWNGYLSEWENNVPISYILSLARIQSKFHMNAHISLPTSINLYIDSEWIKTWFTYHL